MAQEAWNAAERPHPPSAIRYPLLPYHMRSIPNSLTLIVPDIAPEFEEAVANGLARWPLLARFAGRGSLRNAQLPEHRVMLDLSPWQASVLEALGLDAHASLYPSAAVSRTGMGQERGSACWVHLQWVHFAAGLSDVTASTLQREAALSKEEERALGLTVNEHVAQDGYELLPGTGGINLLRCPRRIEADTMAPRFAFRRPLQQALPSGTDAAQLRKLMTELQMLLHDHPVNIRRTRLGLPAANAAWLWGIGTIDPGSIVRAQAIPAAFGGQPYLQGVYLLNDSIVAQESFDAETLFRSRDDGARLAVIDACGLDALESQWLSSCFRALREGFLDRLALHLDHWRIEANRRDLLRFWRKPLAPMNWSS